MLIALGDHAVVRCDLNQVQQFVGQFPSHVLKVHLLRATAQLFFATGEKAQGLAALRHVFKIVREQGCIDWSPWWIPKVMSQLCARTLNADIEIPYVWALIKARGLFPIRPFFKP